MKPQHLPGDLVTAYVWKASSSNLPFASKVAPSRVVGLVISVQQANQVPDAKLRGISDIYPWSYWVLSCLDNRVFGPIDGHLVHRCG